MTEHVPSPVGSGEALADLLAIADDLELMECFRLANRLREAAALLTEQSRQPQCPHGENCGCAISTRHEWFVAFSEEREKLREQSSQQEAWLALVKKWRELAEDEWSGGKEWRGGAAFGRLNCAAELEALAAPPQPKDTP